MAETLGMLCDKLTIVKLKQYHTEDTDMLKSLNAQIIQLQTEIDEYLNDAIVGKIPLNKLTFDSNKVFKKDGNEVGDILGGFGEVFSTLAAVNCTLWHEQEKVYDFEKIEYEQKDIVVKQLAILNLQRNKCIDSINNQFLELIKKN